MSILAIRPEQLATLEDQAVERFRRETIASLRREQRDQVADLPDQTLRDIVDYGAALCDTYDITAEPLVEAYIHLMIGYGLDLDEEPWAAEILLDEELGEEERVHQLALFAEDLAAHAERAGS